MQTLRRFLRLIAPYWFNRNNRTAWALLAADTARALIARPHILYLDEATNQLDDTSAAELMHILRQCLPDVLCIGISHQARIQELFERRVDLAGFMEGEMAVCEAEGTT